MTPQPSITQYRFAIRPELFWFVLVSVLSVLFQALLEFDATLVTDWQAWAIGIGSALVRAAAGAFLAYVAKEGMTYKGQDHNAHS